MSLEAAWATSSATMDEGRSLSEESFNTRVIAVQRRFFERGGQRLEDGSWTAGEVGLGEVATVVVVEEVCAGGEHGWGEVVGGGGGGAVTRRDPMRCVMGAELLDK